MEAGILLRRGGQQRKCSQQSKHGAFANARNKPPNMIYDEELDGHGDEFH
jgi:hypothetical protein